MPIRAKAEYDAAVSRAAALGDAPEGSAEEAERSALVADIRGWDEEHKGENQSGLEPVDGLNRPDDMSVSGLPGNLGKLRAP